MLSLTVISANQGETYYTAENYYTSEENQAHSGWWGQGAKSLGLAGQVQGATSKICSMAPIPRGTKPYRVERLTRSVIGPGWI
jgi:hypothetical protein